MPVTTVGTTPSDEPEADLGRSVRRGAWWSLLNSAVGRVGQVVVGIVLARLLAPEDFGLFAVATVMYAVIVSCSELGVTVGIVRHPDQAARLGPTVTTLAWASAAALTGLCWWLAPVLATAMSAPGATGVIRLLSLALLIAGVTAVPAAVVQRDFRQDVRLVADTLNLVASTVVAVVGALTGHGAMALAGSRVAGNAVSAVVLVVLVREWYRPGWQPVVARESLRAGLPLAGASLLSFAVLNVDYVVVGHRWGPAVLGVYVLAFNLSSWPVTVFSTVARSVSLPTFARLRGDRARASAAYLRALQLLFAASALVSVLFAVLARPLVSVVYGQVWVAAALPLAFLAALGTFRVVHELSYDYLVGLGSGPQVLAVQGLWFLALCVALPLGASVGGLAGVGTAHLVVAGVLVLPAYGRQLSSRAVHWPAVARSLRRPLAATVAAGAAAAGGSWVVDGPWKQLLLGGALGTAAFLLVAGPLLPVEQRAAAVDRLRGLVARRRPAQATPPARVR